MIADQISTGHGWAADFFFLLAVIFAVIAAALELYERRPRPARSDGVLRSYPWTPVAGWVAVAFVALGLLVL